MTVWQRATQADLPRVHSLLRAARASAMFASSNLTEHGLDQDHPRSMRFWVNGDTLLGISGEGVLFPVVGGDAADWTAMRDALSGASVSGCLGLRDAARPLLAALGLGGMSAQHDADEPLLYLDLSEMIMPRIEGLTLSPITPAFRDLAVAWRMSYQCETLNHDTAVAAATAPGAIDSYIARDSHRLLLRDGEPVAMTGFNARADDIVQIGGVYTPPPLRGNGFARAAVALHLSQASAQGARRSVLTAANPIAARAYRAIGYHRIGTFTFWLLPQPVTL